MSAHATNRPGPVCCAEPGCAHDATTVPAPGPDPWDAFTAALDHASAADRRLVGAFMALPVERRTEGLALILRARLAAMD